MISTAENKILLALAVLLTIHYSCFSKTRVVSLSPAVTEMIFAIGRGELIVGRSSQCNIPSAVRKIPVAGDFALPNIEKITMLKADVVVCDTPVINTAFEQLKKNGIKTVLLKNRCIDDYYQSIAALGKLLDADEEAEKESLRFRKEISKFKSAKLFKSPKVLILLGTNPLVSCGRNSFVNEIVSLAGAENIASGVKQPYFVLSPEFVVVKDPDAVIAAGTVGDISVTLKNIPAWKHLNFIKKQAIIDNINPDLLCRLSPRTPQAIKALQDALWKVCKKQIRVQADKADAD